jgi:hypothetical protein
MARIPIATAKLVDPGVRKDLLTIPAQAGLSGSPVQQGSVMTRWVCVTAVVLALSGCCGGSAEFQARTAGPYVQPLPVRTALDGFGKRLTSRRPAKVQKTAHRTPEPDGIAAKEAELTTLKAYSPEWWSVRDAIDRARDARLAKTLIICSSCLPPPSEDRTGSIDAR